MFGNDINELLVERGNLYNPIVGDAVFSGTMARTLLDIGFNTLLEFEPFQSYISGADGNAGPLTLLQ